MILEMKRALEELKKGDSQGYRRLYDATYEEVYCRALLIIQREDYALEFIKDFYKEIFGVLDEAEDAADTERWFLHRYYQKLRKHYHRLLGKLEKTESDGVKTLAEIPATFPLLHRIMLVMSFKDDFKAAEISGIYGLAEDKIQSELEKLQKLLPSITKDQPDSVEAYLGSWKVLLLGASRQITNAGTDHWVDTLFAEAAKAAGVSAETKKDDFDYFIADPEPEPEKPKKKIIPIVKEEPEDEDDEDDEDEDDEDEDDEYEDDEDEDDDRYDWDMEDDGRKMIILGIVLAVIIVAIIGIAAFKLLGKDDDGEKDPIQTEQDADADDNKLIVKGGEEGSDEEEPQETPVEEPEDEPEETPVEEPEEVEELIMRVNGNSINVRSEPNTSSSILTKVKKDDKVEVLGDPTGEWVQIRCIEQNNEEGYMMSQYLSNIE